MTFDPEPFDFLAALSQWAISFGGLLIAVFVLATVFSLIARGAAGPMSVLAQIRAAGKDWSNISLGRVFALTRLTFQEAYRRKTLYVFVVFALLIMFGGWFMSDSNQMQELQTKVYVSFVLTSISWLALPVALLLSCWGIPEDIRARSLHTVLTKPVRRNEIILGRVFGFALINTLVLTVMATVGLIWIYRSTAEAAVLDTRVPVYGELSWLDRNGEEANAGINTGDMWAYREYIEGNSKARAIWDFDLNAHRINPEIFGDSLPLESTFQAFRTVKGAVIAETVLYQYTFVNPRTKLRVANKPLSINEFHDRDNFTEIHRKLTGDDGKEYDLFNDLFDEGKLRIEVRCLSGGQYLGMAKADLFLRLPPTRFWFSFAKAVFGVWMMVMMVVVLGVTASSILKGPVATLLTLVVLIVGKSSTQFMGELVTGQVKGGGPFEAAVRLVKHMNPQTAMEEGFATTLVQLLDMPIIGALRGAASLIPDFQKFDLTEYVANGFDVPFSAGILPGLASSVGYMIPWIFFAYLCLSLRELESK